MHEMALGRMVASKVPTPDVARGLRAQPHPTAVDQPESASSGRGGRKMPMRFLLL